MIVRSTTGVLFSGPQINRVCVTDVIDVIDVSKVTVWSARAKVFEDYQNFTARGSYAQDILR